MNHSDKYNINSTMSPYQVSFCVFAIFICYFFLICWCKLFQKVAIKKMDKQASREFLAELKVLTHVHHLNLVSGILFINKFS